MSERKLLYDSRGEKGKRGFEDLECYQLALEVMAKLHAFSKTLPPDEKFESLYKLIRQTEQTLNGYMTYVRRQRAGSQEYGDKKLREASAEYEMESYTEEKGGDK